MHAAPRQRTRRGRILTWQSWLAERPIGVIATTDEDGLPHAVPVEVVVDGSFVYCWAKATSRKVANVERDGRAALVAYKSHAFVLVRGEARALSPEHETYQRVTPMFLRKYDREETYGNDRLIEIIPARVASSRVD